MIRVAFGQRRRGGSRGAWRSGALWKSLAALGIPTLLLASLSAQALAHAAPYSWLDLRILPDSLAGEITAHVYDLAHDAGIARPETLLHHSTAENSAAALQTFLSRRFTLVADGDTLRPRWTSVAIVPTKNAVALRFIAPWPKPPAALDIQAQLFPYDPAHETYVNVYEGAALRHQDLFDVQHFTTTVYAGGRQGHFAVVKKFIAAGIHHIFIGPDHILFLIALLLLGGSLGRLLKIITGFTVAHSITLALATLGWVQPSPRIIEPLIALSIVYVGIENLRAKPGTPDHRALVAFGFGFVHGFGFASVLRELGLPPDALGWSLFAFNVGVELGQATIVAVATPVLAAAVAASGGERRRVVTVGSWVVTAAGSWWFIERAFVAR
jgi:hypothetical protein